MKQSYKPPAGSRKQSTPCCCTAAAYNTQTLEMERLQLQEELNVVAELIQQCIKENARIALDQKEYQKRYDGLAKRLENVQERLDEVSQTITEKQAHREKIELFLAGLQKQEDVVIEFDEVMVQLG